MTVGRFFCLLFVLRAATLLAASDSDCANPSVGKYVDLTTLNSIEVTKKCKFVFRGANCSVAGDFSSNVGTEGDLKLQVKAESEVDNEKSRLTCPPMGEHTCKFLVADGGFKWECAPHLPVSFVRVKESYDRKALLKKMKKGSRESENELLLYLYDSKQYATLSAHLREMSQRGANEANSALGYNYYYGSHGFTQDHAEAFYWNRLAADAGFVHSQMLLGNQYLYGQGTEKNDVLAEESFLKAAESDEVISQKALAGMILMEKSDPKTVEKARKWLERARELGDVQAKEFLAQLDTPEREVAQIDSEVFWRSSDGEHEVRYYESLFQFRPYYVVQERQGSLPSMAIAFTPGLTYENMTIKAFGSVSLLNVGVGDVFAAYEASLVGRYAVGKDFIEAGMGREFWPSPSGSATTLSVGVGRTLDYPLLGEFSVKSLTLGLAQTFFQDHTYKVFLGVSF